MDINARDPRTNSHQPNTNYRANSSDLPGISLPVIHRLTYALRVGRHLLPPVVDQRPNLPGIDRVVHPVRPFRGSRVAVDRFEAPIDFALMEHGPAGGVKYPLEPGDAPHHVMDVAYAGTPPAPSEDMRIYGSVGRGLNYVVT